MSKYKKIMLNRGIMQKEVLDNLRRIDPRIDKSLLSKIVNDICLPTPPTLESICKTLCCNVFDLYDQREIYIARNSVKNDSKAVATARKSRGGLSHCDNIYNLTVEIPRDIAERVFAKDSLRKLGYLNKTDFIRQVIIELDKKLTIYEKEIADSGKAADDNKINPKG